MSQPSPQALLKGLQIFQKAKELHAAKAFSAAADAFRQALTLVPDHPQMLISYGQLAEDVEDWIGAEKIYRRLLAVKPVADLDGKIAETLYHQGRNEEAIPLFAAYTARNPGHAVAWRLYGTCCFRSLRFDDTLRCAQRSWELDKHPDTLSLMMAVHLELGDGDALAPLVEEALARYPADWQVRKLSAEHLLKSGDYRRGIAQFGAMRVNGDGFRHYVEDIDLPWWDGKHFDGTLLVGAEQGIGDEIMSSSIYAELIAMQQKAIIEADPRLVTLLTRAFPALTFIPRNQRALQDIAANGGSLKKTICGNLGQFFRGEPGWHAQPGGWLHADAQRTEHFRAQYRARWPGRLLVGLSWKSQRVMASGVRKDAPLASLVPIIDVAGTQFVNLQYGDITDDIRTLPEPARLHVDPDLDVMNDMESLFAQVAALDLVITTSNVTAHVAGALGKPCWVMLPRSRPVLWYWGYRGDSTPFYPATRLFRNTSEDDWTALVDAVAGNLRQTVDRMQGTPTP